MSNGARFLMSNTGLSSLSWDDTTERAMEVKQASLFVTHRPYGDIPGITPACDVFVNIPMEHMRVATAARAETFCFLMHNLKYQDFQNHPFHREDVKLSLIHNAAPRARQTWDSDFQG